MGVKLTAKELPCNAGQDDDTHIGSVGLSCIVARHDVHHVHVQSSLWSHEHDDASVRHLAKHICIERIRNRLPVDEVYPKNVSKATAGQ